MKQIHRIVFGLTVVAIVIALASHGAPGAAAAQPPTDDMTTSLCTPLTPADKAAAAADGSGQNLWQPASDTAVPARASAQRAVNPVHFHSYTLYRDGMAALLATAPSEYSEAARRSPLVLSLPNPCGDFERFAVQESPVMEPGLAVKHPDIKTYNGRGIDDPAATIRFDLTPLGFHASVRSPHGVWYVDPYYHLDDSLYVTYFGRDLAENPHGTFVEREAGTPEISADRGYYHPTDMVQLHGDGFAADAPITITIFDQEGAFAPRTVETQADADGSFDVGFVADPNGDLGTHQLDANDGTDSAYGTYDVVTDDDTSVDPPVGDQLRIYRLALLTDPAYATYFGGNTTAAKVTLINRVTQVYEDETSIRMVLIANNDALNLDSAAQMTGTNGPCGGAACFTTTQANTCGNGTLTRNRQVIGLLVGASNYDIGHIALGVPGGGIASLGVVGSNNKAQGCTGLSTPVGDFFAVDYVAHEMGHQFAANHTFNGTQSNCSGGNRNPATSVEPGSGSSIMAYAGICATDDLQAHSDPYWSQKSFDEITTYNTAAETNINEVQIGALTNFTTNGQSFQLRYNGNDSAAIVRGTNFTTAGVQAAILGITGWPAGGTATVSALGNNAFTITFGGTLANTNVSELQLVNCTGGCSGYVSEIAKGGQTTRGGSVTATGYSIPTAAAPASFTIPLQTPFALTGSGSDPDTVVTYMWEQNDRGGAFGTALTNNAKANGPLFRQFGKAAIVADPLSYNSPGENAVSTDPTRVFPDLDQILANNTNAETGICPTASNPPTSAEIDCYSEFLPTPTYIGAFGVNFNPLSLHFRLTVRAGHPGNGGVNSAITTLLLATNAGPFLVTSPNTAVTYTGGSAQIVTWNPANTNIAPVSADNVKISLSTDGGYTYPDVLAASTPNDGSEPVVLPNVGTTQARVKVEAVGNIFFDLSNANFAIQALPVVINSLGEGGSQTVQYSDSLSPDVTITATDADSRGVDLNAVAVGLPAGMSLSIMATSDDSTLPGSRTWKVTGATTAAPSSYPVTVTVTDETGGSGTTSFTIVVTQEDAEATYTGDMLAFTASGSSSANVLLRATVRDISVVPAFGDTEPGDVRNATVTFKEGATTLCGPLAVALINGDTTTGSANCTTSLGIGAHQIDVYVNNYYIGVTSAIVEVAQPNGSFITGGGYLTIGTSGGTYMADTGSKMNFGFNVSYRSPRNPKGHVNIVFRRDGRNYQIKSNAIDSLGVVLRTPGGAVCSGPPSATCYGIANFRSKANLTDVTNPQAPIPLGGNLSLQVTMTDQGEPGSSDTFGVTLWNRDTLLFSSEWDGTKTIETLIGGGNLAVHP